MGRDRERRDGVVWSEGGRGSRAHSPELIVARVLVIAHVLVVTHVLVIACVRSWALTIICEPWWLLSLVVGRMCRGSWVMVKGAHWLVVALFSSQYGCLPLWAVIVCRGGQLLSYITIMSPTAT